MFGMFTGLTLNSMFTYVLQANRGEVVVISRMMCATFVKWIALCVICGWTTMFMTDYNL